MMIVETSEIPCLDKIQSVSLEQPMEIYKVCRELQELCDRESGIGISAVQVGIPWKLFLVKGDGSCPLIPSGTYGYFLNCIYSPVTEEKVVSLEGCLSLKTTDGQLRTFQVTRSALVRIEGTCLRTEPKLCFEQVDIVLHYGQQGIVFQHEADHSFGQERLISKIGTEVFLW